MSDNPVDIRLERINRLATAVADMMEGNNRQFRDLARWLGRIDERFDRLDERLDKMDQRLVSIERGVRELASDQVLLGNRVEEAFSRAVKTNIRLDEAGDR